MKWLIGIVTALSVTGCVSPQFDSSISAQFVFAESSNVEAQKATTVAALGSETTTNLEVNLVEAAAIVAKKERTLKMQQLNTEKVSKTIAALEQRVHKTWYVFSGSSPSGWDCSGLVMWTYQQMGVELKHRASVQKESGTIVADPKPGDIVAFTYKGSRYGAYHVGIYLGEDRMIHAGNGPGSPTSIVSIAKFGGKYSEVTYTRILETL